MARSPLSDPTSERSLGSGDVDLLLDIAERAIVAGLRNVRPTVPALHELPDALRRPAGTFVTLNVRGELNGCIGSIESDEPLGVSVARHAWSAAFTDPRLPALRWVDFDHLDIEISILSPLAPIACTLARRPARPARAPGRRVVDRGRSKAGGVPAVGVGAVAVGGDLPRPPLPQGRAPARLVARRSPCVHVHGGQVRPTGRCRWLIASFGDRSRRQACGRPLPTPVSCVPPYAGATRPRLCSSVDRASVS